MASLQILPRCLTRAFRNCTAVTPSISMRPNRYSGSPASHWSALINWLPPASTNDASFADLSHATRRPINERLQRNDIRSTHSVKTKSFRVGILFILTNTRATPRWSLWCRFFYTLGADEVVELSINPRRHIGGIL